MAPGCGFDLSTFSILLLPVMRDRAYGQASPAFVPKLTTQGERKMHHSNN